MNKVWFVKGDIVELNQDLVSVGCIAHKGHRGIVQTDQLRNNCQILVRLNGQSRNSFIDTSFLSMIKMDMDARKNRWSWAEYCRLKIKEHGVKEGKTVMVKSVHTSKPRPVFVVTVCEDGFYGYRVNTKGERQKGGRGITTFFSALELYDKDTLNNKENHEN